MTRWILLVGGLSLADFTRAGAIEGASFTVQPASYPFLSFVVDRIYYSTYFVGGHWQVPATPLTDAGPIPGTAPIIATEGPSPASVVLENGEIYRWVTGGWEDNGNLYSGIAAVGATALPSAVSAFPNPTDDGVLLSLGRDRGPVDVFEANGRLVRHLTDSRRAVRWDGKDGSGTPVPAGVYFWRSTTGTATGRVVVAR